MYPVGIRAGYIPGFQNPRGRGSPGILKFVPGESPGIEKYPTLRPKFDNFKNFHHFFNAINVFQCLETTNHLYFAKTQSLPQFEIFGFFSPLTSEILQLSQKYH